VDALLSTLVAALLAEWGDRTQLLVIAFAVRYRSVAPVLLGVFVGALANSMLAAAGGIYIGDMINLRAMSLLVALALLFAGIGGLIGRSTPDMGESWKVGAFLTTAVCFFLLEFGDKTQFLTLALAGRFDSFLLAGLGATVGIVAANVPAAVLGDRLGAVVPLKAVRLTISGFFIVTGFIVAVNALRLV
jgi:putative Ca2+/H+ antiporter (TMEM165/GDT1 family)